MADNGRKAGSFLLSALMTWSLVPHPVYALPAAGETTGSDDDSATVTNGDSAAAQGWAFDDWRQGSASGAAWTFSDTVSSPVDLVAAWKGIEYPVTLDTDGGTVNAGDVTSYTHGTAQPLPTDVTHVGCTFGGWYTDADYNDPHFHDPGFAGTPVTEVPADAVGAVTYHAKWIPNTYTVTLDPEGGTVLDRFEARYTYGSGFDLPQKVVRPGYTFEGWFTQPDGGTEMDEISDTQAGDLQLFAHWRANDYRLTFEANGGTMPAGAPDGYVHGQACPLPVDVVRDGYTFEGWYDNADFSGSPVTEVAVDAIGDKTFYARWFSQAVEPSYVEVAGTAGVLGNNDVYVELPYGTQALPTDPALIDVALPAGATMTTPVTTDGGRMWRFTVTAEDGKVVRDYTVHVSIAPDPQAQEKADLAAAVSTVQAQATSFWTVPQSVAPTQEATRLWLAGQLAKLPLNGSLYEVHLDSWQAAKAGTAADPDGTDGSFTFTVKLYKMAADGSRAGSTLEAETIVIRGVIKATPYRVGAGSTGDGTGADDLKGQVSQALAHETAHLVPVNRRMAQVSTTGDEESPAQKGLLAGAVATVAASLWVLLGRRKDDGDDRA